jgi:predicted lipoprotein
MCGRRQSIIIASVAAATAVLLYFVPLFHVVSLDQAIQRSGGKSIEPGTFVDGFWTERLIPGAIQAVDAAQLVTALQKDRKSARRTYGHRMGVGGADCYLVAGTGRVVSVGNDSVELSLRDPQTQVHVSLATGKIFGNTVRDGTGLLSVNDFPNSQDFNALSSEINRRIEQQVLPVVRKTARVGATLRFVGCAEVMDEDSDLHPLRIVPFIVETP